MKKTIIFFGLLFIINISIKAQKFEVSYGTIMGLNSSNIGSTAEIDYNYPFNEQDQNIRLTTSTESDLGYNLGIFFNIKPISSRISLESGIIYSKYNNTFTISVDYDKYYSTIDNWMKENETEVVNNEFGLIYIPVILGYNIFQSEKFSLNLNGGISASLSMKTDDVIVDINMDEHQLYKDNFVSFQAGFITYINNIICQFKYERSSNIMEGSSRDYFPWEMKVEKMYLNSISLSVGYRFD